MDSFWFPLLGGNNLVFYVSFIIILTRYLTKTK